MFSRIFTSCLVSLIVALVYGGFSIEHVGAAKITIEQMQQTTEPVKLVCMQKTKVPEDLVLALKKGDISDKKELKCYLNCVFEMMQVTKKGKFQYDAVIKSIDTMMPDELRVDSRRAAEACKDSIVGIKDNCEAGSVLLKCMLKEYPNFFIP